VSYHVSIATDPLRCGDTLWVTAICAADPSCRVEQLLRINCKFEPDSACPTSVTLTVSPPVDPDAPCIPAGTYTVTASVPGSGAATYLWMFGPAGQTVLLAGGGNPRTIQFTPGMPVHHLTAIAQVPGCDPIAATMVFPHVHDGACPTAADIDLRVLRNGQVVPPPYNALQPGSYTVQVVAPVGAGYTYHWFEGDGPPVQIGSSTERLVTVAGGATLEVRVLIQPGECCPQLIAEVELTGTGSPGDDPRDPEDPRDPDVPRDPDGPRDPRDPDSPPPPVSLCAILRWIAAIALVIALVGAVGSLCPVLAPIALPALFAGVIGAIAFLILVAAFCGLSRCRFLNILLWAVKWAILLGLIVALGCMSAFSLALVVVYGIASAILTWMLIRSRCPIRPMFGPP
jgi:hypothetical protein